VCCFAPHIFLNLFFVDQNNTPFVAWMPLLDVANYRPRTKQVLRTKDSCIQMGYEPTLTPLLIYFSTNLNAGISRRLNKLKLKNRANFMDEAVYPFTVLLRVLSMISKIYLLSSNPLL
jgi:hypothetical protein